MTETLPPLAPAKEPDWISVVEVHHDVETDLYTMVVECLVHDGELRKFELAPSQMADPRRALTFLLDRGVVPISDMNKPLKEIEELLRKKDVPTVDIVRRTGWLGQDFIFPHRVVGPRQGRLRYRPVDPRKQIEAERSSCKAWRKAFGPLFEGSSAMTTLAAAAFVGPLLRQLGRTGFPLLHAVGGSAHVRELAIRAALAVAGRSEKAEFLPHGGAPARLQETVEAHRDQSIAFSDHPVHDGVGARRNALEVTAASAVLGSFCAKKDVIPGSQQLVAFSCDRHNADAGLASTSTNLVLVPLHSTGRLLDPSNDESALQEEEALCELEALVTKMWGGALPQFVSKFQETSDAITRAKAYERRFLARVRSKGIGVGEHQARTFALIYSAARLAAEFKVAPWNEKRARSAIIRVLRRSVQHQLTTENVADHALRQLARVRTNNDRFPRVEKGKEFPEARLEMAWGIRRKIGKMNIVAILRDQFHRLVPDGLEQATLRAWAQKGVILPGKDAEHHTKQLQVQGMTPERPSFICVKASVLRKLVPAKAK